MRVLDVHGMIFKEATIYIKEEIKKDPEQIIQRLRDKLKK